jgi:hypothetical protein
MIKKAGNYIILLLNGVIYFMSTSKSELIGLVPKDWTNVISFLENRHENDYYEISEKGNLLKIDEVFIEGRQYLITIDLKRNKIEFTDDLVNFESVSNLFNVPDELDFKEWDTCYNQLKTDMTKYNFSLVNSFNGNEDYFWHYIVTDVSLFNESDLIAATKLWDSYNKDRRSLYEE